MSTNTSDDRIRQRTLPVDGVELHVVEAGEPGAPVVLLAHGFPELAYSWRHQMLPLAAAGYHMVAPDQRGYGGTTAPEAITDYDILALTGDLVGVLDDVGAEQATVVGHDWGSMVVSHLAMLHPDRVRALVNMSVPHLGRGQVRPTEVMRQLMGDNFFYMLYFQEPGVADANLGADAEVTMRRMLCGTRIGAGGDDPDAAARFFAPGPEGFVERLPDVTELPDWLTPEELDHYVAAFTRTGFTGGINWYRNLDRNWELTPQLDGVTVDVPALFIGGALDPVLMMSPPALAHDHLTDHRGDVLVDDAGHWVQQEQPGDTNRALLEFLSAVH